MSGVKKTSEVLREAATNVNHGWCRSQVADAHGNVCVYGAIWKAVTGHLRDLSPLPTGVQAACEALQDVLEEQFKTRSFTVVNDELATDKHEIMACLEKAALRCEEAGR